MTLYISTSNNHRLFVAFLSMADPSIGLWRYLRPADTRGSDCKFESFPALVISASSHWSPMAAPFFCSTRIGRGREEVSVFGVGIGLSLSEGDGPRPLGPGARE